MRAASFPPRATDFIDIKSDGGTRIFHSTERFLIREIKRSILAVAKEAGIPQVALYDAGETGQAREAFASAREVGFFGARNLVILDYAEAIFDKKEKKEKSGKKKADPLQAMLEAAVENPEPANLLIILATAMDRRSRFYKQWEKKRSLFHELPPPERSDLTAFIVAQFGPVRPDQRLINHFLQKEQSDLFYIGSEVAKLRLWAESNGKNALTLADTDGMLSSFGEERIFRIMDHLVQKETARAIGLYRDLLVSEGEAKIHPLLIALFMRHFRVILDGRVLLKRGLEREVPGLIQANNAFHLMRNYAAVFARYKNRTVVTALRDAAALELGMKGVYGVAMPDVSAAIEQFMLKYF